MINQIEIVKSASVLIVDDNPKNLQVLGSLLQKEWIDVEFALDGYAALSWLEKKRFDLVLLDIMMPGMDGFEVCSIIKENHSLSDIPIIFITAKTDNESIINGFKTGAVDYITKPFIPGELLARVNAHVNLKRSKEKILSYLNEIEVQNKSIRESIEYARNIQRAVLNTSLSAMGSYPENFILYLPKDILSGDFYWYYKSGNIFLLAVMDSTGHGVPGALMSILGMTLLTEIVVHNQIMMPDEILECLRSKLIISLGQNQKTMKITDGIEGSIISYDSVKRQLNFSGSFNPLLHIHNKEMNKINGDKISIGYSEKESKFSLKTITIEKGDIIYLYSDGYVDQFGGTEKRKIMSWRLMDVFKEIHNLIMDEQKSKLNDFINHWKGDLEQTDDILIVGIRF